MKVTAELVEFFISLFDSVYCYLASKGKLRKTVKNNSPYLPFWTTKAIKILEPIKFEDRSKLAIQIGKFRLKRVPSIEDVGRLPLWKVSLGHQSYCLINLALIFITPETNLKNSFKSLLKISNFLSPQSKFSNCEEDNGVSVK